MTTATKPAGAITFTLPDGRVIGVWCAQTAVGGYLGAYVQKPDGTWDGPNDNGYQYADFNFNNNVMNGGAVAWINGFLQWINAVLKALFSGAQPVPVGPLDQVNAALGAGFKFVLVNGVPTIQAK